MVRSRLTSTLIVRVLFVDVLLVLCGTELFNYVMTTLTWHYTSAQSLTSSAKAPAGDDVTRHVPVWCQPCGIRIDRDLITSPGNATFQLKLAMEASLPLAKRLQRSTLVHNTCILAYPSHPVRPEYRLARLWFVPKRPKYRLGNFVTKTVTNNVVTGSSGWGTPCHGSSGVKGLPSSGVARGSRGNCPLNLTEYKYFFFPRERFCGLEYAENAFALTRPPSWLGRGHTFQTQPPRPLGSGPRRHNFWLRYCCQACRPIWLFARLTNARCFIMGR